MKVAHVETGMHLYGGALQVLFLLRGLRDLPGENILVCPEESAIARAAVGVADRIYPTVMRGDLDWGFSGRLRAILRRERPVLVHIHSRRGADTWGAWASRREGVPMVLSRRVDNPEPRWLVRWKYRRYARVITISEGIRDVLLAEGLPPEKVVCVASAVDTERYRPHGDRAWLRHEFDLPASARAVGMAAQFIERKGHRVLLDALPAIVDACPDAYFLLFGQGPLQSTIARLRTERGLTPRVRLAGFREDLDSILPCLDLLVHPALLEGLGVILLQGAACGLPLVASRVGGIPEIVRDGVNGILTPAGDAVALSRAVIALLSDPARAAAYGQAGRRIVEADFSIPAMVAGNYRVYQEVLGTSARHAAAGEPAN